MIQVLIAGSGSLEHDGKSYMPWSLIYVGHGEESLLACAGSGGLEALVLNFPRVES